MEAQGALTPYTDRSLGTRMDRDFCKSPALSPSMQTHLKTRPSRHPTKREVSRMCLAWPGRPLPSPHCPVEAQVTAPWTSLERREDLPHRMASCLQQGFSDAGLGLTQAPVGTKARETPFQSIRPARCKAHR